MAKSKIYVLPADPKLKFKHAQASIRKDAKESPFLSPEGEEVPAVRYYTDAVDAGLLVKFPSKKAAAKAIAMAKKHEKAREAAEAAAAKAFEDAMKGEDGKE